MGSKVTLESLSLYINRGITPKYTEELERSITVINQKCIRDYKVSLAPSRLNDLSKRKITEGKTLEKYDVLINSTGVGTLGRVAQFFGDSGTATVDSHVTIVRPNSLKIDPVYFGYLIKSKQYLIESFAEGSTGQTELARNSVKELEVEVVEGQHNQKKIGETLLSIDKKLEVNRQTNQTLEQMAKALFKSWFVDFDPVIDNALEAGNKIPEPLKKKAERRAAMRAQQKAQATQAAQEAQQGAVQTTLQPPLQEPSQTQSHATKPAHSQANNSTANNSATNTDSDQVSDLLTQGLPEHLRALFPSEFEETDELGWVPKGWGIKNMTQLVDTISNTYPLKTVDQVIFLNTGDIENGVFLHSDLSNASTLPGQAKKSIQQDDILYSEIRPKNKRFAYVNFESSQHVVSTKLMVLRSKGIVDSKFAYFILTQEKTLSDLQSIAELRSGTFPQITFKELSSIKLPIPNNDDILNQFSEVILDGYFKKHFQLQDQNNQLTKLRDTLLPKLISGELRLPEMDTAPDHSEASA